MGNMILHMYVTASTSAEKMQRLEKRSNPFHIFQSIGLLGKAGIGLVTAGIGALGVTYIGRRGAHGPPPDTLWDAPQTNSPQYLVPPYRQQNVQPISSAQLGALTVNT
eukprot:NODE_834_length_3829_cov_0.219035.p2 type:complete len:108 gc:universal NODE_834_length_3829_cov_0.219035:385-62(-)